MVLTLINMEQEFIENELIILTKATIDRFLKEENPADLIALYTFFYYTAKWQKTNIVKATQGYVKKGLGWGIDKLTRNESKLIELGLIEKITRRDKQGKVIGWFVKVKYIFTKNSVDLVQNTQKPLVDEATCGKQETNALSTSNINTLITNKEYIQVEAIKEEKADTSIKLPIHRGKTSHQRVDSIYSDLFYNKYGFKPPYALIGQRLKVFKEVLEGYTEIQVARLLITFFEWRGMLGDSDWEEKKIVSSAHSIYIFKSNLPSYEAHIRNVQGQSKEFENDSELLSIVGNYIISLNKTN